MCALRGVTYYLLLILTFACGCESYKFNTSNLRRVVDMRKCFDALNYDDYSDLEVQKVNISLQWSDLCYVKNGRPYNRRCFYDDLQGHAYLEDINPNIIEPCHLRHCESEEFEHDYIVSGRELQPHVNKWKHAKVGQRVGLRDLCLKPNGLPVTRKCLLVAGRGVWQNISDWQRVRCLQQTHEETISLRLNSLHDEILDGQRHLNNSQDRRQVATVMHEWLCERKRRLLPADVHVTGQILKTLVESSDAALSQNVLSICSSFMASDKAVLRLSANVNATNSLLSTFEGYMDELPAQLVPQHSCGKRLATPTDASINVSDVESMNFAHIGVQAHITTNISVFFVNPQCANITGIGVYTEQGADRHESKGGFWYRFLYAHETIAALRAETGLEVAAFLPAALWDAVQGELQRQYKSPFLVYKVYAHDGLFVETATVLNHRPRSKVLSVSLPGYTVQLPAPLPFLLRNQNLRDPDSQASSTGSGCGYWNYETWASDGVHTSSNGDTLHEPVIVCSTQHLTQFSFLLGGSYRQNSFDDAILVTPLHEKVLDIISLIGCSLSLLGLMGIWLTAALFRSWRSQASTKVLLNLCIALTLQMILFVFVNTDGLSEELVSERDYTRCVLLGASLQYSILVLFSWMLIVAFLQFQRYVTVIGIQRPKHYLIKSAIAAWGLPLIPTLLVALIDPKSYIPTQQQLQTDTGVCYPSGHGLTFGVVLPVSLITIGNLLIFIYVFYSISHSLSQTMQRTERNMIIQQIRLSVLLFFLLGLNWIFGIFAFMRAGIAFSYLFCITATLQGFVLFIFFVILDPVTRDAWAQLLCPATEGKRLPKRASEMQSMTTSSTNFSSKSHA